MPERWRRAAPSTFRLKGSPNAFIIFLVNMIYFINKAFLPNSITVYSMLQILSLSLLRPPVISYSLSVTSTGYIIFSKSFYFDRRHRVLAVITITSVCRILASFKRRMSLYRYSLHYRWSRTEIQRSRFQPFREHRLFTSQSQIFVYKCESDGY